MLDNSELIIPFVPDHFDGDTFIYTELLNRGQRKGNNGHRIVKTFYHRSREEFAEQLPVMKHLCDMTRVRACARLAPRSYKKVGREFTRLVVETALTENWAGMKTLYARACGIVTPNQKLWLFDVDAISAGTDEFAKLLEASGVLRGRIPSKKGEHLIAVPFNPEPFVGKRVDSGWSAWGEIQLHKDNPTNLYIPDGAE